MGLSQIERPVRIMTYADIEAEMGLKPASARQLVRRNGWRRVPGNDGRSRIEVPVTELERFLQREPNHAASLDENGADTPSAPPSDSPFEASLVTALNSHIKRLERAITDGERTLSTVIAERDEIRDLMAAVREDAWEARSQVSALRAQLEAEREKASASAQRFQDLISDRDKWHSAATTHRSWWKRLVG